MVLLIIISFILFLIMLIITAFSFLLVYGGTSLEQKIIFLLMTLILGFVSVYFFIKIKEKKN